MFVCGCLLFTSVLWGLGERLGAGREDNVMRISRVGMFYFACSGMMSKRKIGK